MSKGKGIVRTYVLCVLGTVSLLAGAFFLPQVIFVIQDKYFMADTEVEARTNLDILQINSLYEKSTNVRMQNLSLMNLQDVEITAIDYDSKEEEIVRELTDLLRQDWMERLNDITLYSYNDVFYSGYNDELYSAAEIRECKKYIVYKKDFSEGVALMMWYFDVLFPMSGTRMRLLADSETGTIYYVKLQDGAEPAEVINDKYAYEVSQSVKNSMEIFYVMADAVGEYVDFYVEYYEADSIDDYEKIKKGESPWYSTVKVEKEECLASISLPYGEISMEFDFHAWYDEQSNLNVSTGIRAIGNLFPEMMQN